MTLALLGVLLAAASMYMAVFAVPPLITTFVDDLGFSHTEAGLLMTTFLAVYAPCSLLSGHVVDRIGASRTMVIGLVICAVATLTFPLTSSLGPMLVQRAVIGVGAALVYAPAIRYVSALVPANRIALGVGVYIGALQVGIAIVFFATPRIEDSIGWEWAFVIYGLVLVVSAVALALTTLPTERYLATEVPKASMVSLPRLLRDRGLVLVCAGLFVAMFTTYGVYTWIPPFLEEEAGFSVSQVSNAAMLTALVGVPAVILAGWLAGRLGRPLGVAAGLLAMAAVMIVYSFADDLSFGVGTAVAVVASFGATGGVMPLFALPAMIVASAAVARAAALATFSAQAGGIASTYLGGWLIGATGGYTEAFIIYAITALLTALIVLPAASVAIRRHGSSRGAVG